MVICTVGLAFAWVLILYAYKLVSVMLPPIQEGFHCSPLFTIMLTIMQLLGLENWLTILKLKKNVNFAGNF